MYNSFLKNRSSNSVFKTNGYCSLPLQSQKKSIHKYQTPYKMSNTTNVSKNATLSTYSFTSKKQTIGSNKSYINKEKNVFRFKGK